MGDFTKASGYGAKNEQSLVRTNEYQPCVKCGEEYWHPRLKERGGLRMNTIVGRSVTGLYVCRDCYEKGECFDYRDKAIQDFQERHAGGEWGVAIRASHFLESKDDKIDLMAFLKKKASRIGNPRISTTEAKE